MSEKFRYWAFLVYPDSAPENWVSLLQSTGLPFAISPLHNLDVYDKDDLEKGHAIGELKKEHYHVLVCFNGPTTFNNVYSQICSLTNSPIPIKVLSVKGKYEYWYHKNNPEKAQYSKDDIIHLNGFCIDNYVSLTATELQNIIFEIDDDIIKYNFREYASLRLFYKYTDLSKYKFVNSHSMLWKSYFSSLRGGGGVQAINKSVLDVIEKNNIKVVDDYEV